MSEHAKRSAFIGVAQAVAGYGWWGFVTALYYHWLIGPNPFDLVSWRAITALPVVFVMIRISKSGPELLATITDWSKIRWLCLSALLILVNWFVFIWAVVNEQVLDASLGYYMNPLVSVALGAVVLRERLRTIQWIAVGIAFLGVCWLALMLGSIPWIAIALAISFPLYGLIRKKCPSSAIVGLTVEMALLTPFLTAISVIFFLKGESSIQTGTALQLLILPLSGLVTVVPLGFFSAAARRLKLSTVGMLQYIAPTGQFVTAVLIFGEQVLPELWVAFACVWVGIIIYSTEAIQQQHKRD
jgi:chloramphenicol-sensitive protein RarD